MYPILPRPRQVVSQEWLAMRSYSGFILERVAANKNCPVAKLAHLERQEADCGERLPRCTPVTPPANITDCNESRCYRHSPENSLLNTL